MLVVQVASALVIVVVHSFAHPLQFSGSLVVSTHVLPQSVGALAGHPVPHPGAPLESVVHTGVPPEHVTPHPPQFPCWARFVSHPSPASSQFA